MSRSYWYSRVMPAAGILYVIVGFLTDWKYAVIGALVLGLIAVLMPKGARGGDRRDAKEKVADGATDPLVPGHGEGAQRGPATPPPGPQDT